MNVITRAKFVMLAPLLTSCLVASPLVAQSAHPAPAKRKVVALTPGSCAQVAAGDELVFEWNPAFENPAMVTGMQRITMLFAQRGQEQAALQDKSGFYLIANRDAKRAGLRGSTIAPLPNGFFQVHFRPVVLYRVQPGQYNLVWARADARMDPRYHGPRLLSTNDPAHSFFCLDVVAASKP
jgi:hypothetical protein